MANGIVGVDIGSNSLRAVEVLDAAGSKPSVARYFEVPLASPATEMSCTCYVPLPARLAMFGPCFRCRLHHTVYATSPLSHICNARRRQKPGT